MENENSLTADERDAVRKLAKERGDTEAAKVLGISVDSLLRVVAERDLRRGTLYLLRSKLEEMKLVRKRSAATAPGVAAIERARSEPLPK
jgi:hypothetical protein